MKKVVLLIIFVAFFRFAFAQSENTYWTSGGEWIFSWADFSDPSQDFEPVIRFAPVFNFQSHFNIDLSENFGTFVGIAYRNVGFIADVGGGVRKKYRTYNLGIPVGFKLGNLNGTFLYGGYEFEIPFHYKEKTFVNEIKEEKKTVWFTDRVNSTQHAVFAGIQFPKGANLKFKYYLSNFFNEDFREVVDDVSVRPYAGVTSNIFYISLNFKIFKNDDFYYDGVNI